MSAPCGEVAVQRWDGAQLQPARDTVAEESPVALCYGGVPHVVMMATPEDLADLATGFTLSEGIVESRDEIRSLDVRDAGDNGHEVQLSIAPERMSLLLQQRRNLAGRTGCGVCGAETVAQVLRQPAQVGAGIRVSSAELHGALLELRERQTLNARTGTLHAAAWCLPGRGIQLVREDVGRHNALDKVIGALARGGHDCRAGYLLITSRASFEMALKAATVGVSVLAAVSGPTGLAIRVAASSGLTLIGFARPPQHVLYTHPQRVAP